MKKSKILNGLLVVAVCAAMILPSIASANYGWEKQEKNHPKKATTTPEKIIPKKVSFCEGLGAWETKSLEKITARDKKLEADWQKWVKKLADERIAYDSRLESERAQADKVRMEKYIKPIKDTRKKKE